MGRHSAEHSTNTKPESSRSISPPCYPPACLVFPNKCGHGALAAGVYGVLLLRLTRIKVVDSHAVFLASPDAEQLPMEVDGVDILSAAHVQEVPSDPLLLSHHQPRQCVIHVAVDG